MIARVFLGSVSVDDIMPNMHFRRRWVWGLVLVCLFGAYSAHAALNANVKLVYQVAALETLQQLDLSADQLRAIQKLAAGVKPATAAGRAKMSDAYRSALSDYRKALLAGDEEKISDAEMKVSDLREKDEDAAEAEIDATETARRAVPRVLALLHPGQIASYMSDHSEDIPDPLQTMLDALDEMAGKADAEYMSIKLEAADQVAMLLVGLDPSAQAPLVKKVSDWIESAHKLSADELKAKRPSLEASAKEIVKQPDPIECLRHWLQRDLADLLSNPELPEMLNARLKNP